MAFGVLKDEKNWFKWLLWCFENYEYNPEPTKVEDSCCHCTRPKTINTLHGDKFTSGPQKHVELASKNLAHLHNFHFPSTKN